MRILLGLYLLFFSSLCLAGNRIDSLQSDKDVELFVKRIKLSPYQLDTPVIVPTDSLKKIFTCEGVFEKWGMRNWEKADFNEDGHTDLFVIINWKDQDQFTTYAIMDNGNNSFKPIYLPSSIFNECILLKPVKVRQKQTLLYYHKVYLLTRKNRNDDKIPFTWQTDTLIFRNGNFLELNESPADYDIVSIKFSTTRCYGSCPVFEMRIKKDLTGIYNAERYNPKNGHFKTRIRKESYDSILAHMNYIRIKELNDYYAATMTDHAAYRLKIEFSDGTVKDIYDYATSGPLGLSRLYRFFFELRLNHDWK